MNKRLFLLLFCLLLAACAAPSSEAASLPVLDPGIDPQSWAKIPSGAFLSGPHSQAATLGQ